MPNEPKKSDENRGTAPPRSNDQDNHEGSSHKPEEFDTMNPARQSPAPKRGTTPQR